jgi:hypothetical protein
MNSSSLAEPTKTVKRKPSSINRPRTSIGPPPAKKENQPPATSSKPRQVDESFLTRMMRPTQASASKTTEKAPTTPPRKSAPRQQGTSNPRSSGGKTSSSASGQRTGPKLAKKSNKETIDTEDGTAAVAAKAPPKMSTIVNVPEVAVHDGKTMDATPTEANEETRQDASSPSLVSPLEEVATDTSLAIASDDVPVDNVDPDDEFAPVDPTLRGETESKQGLSAAIIKDDKEKPAEKSSDVEEPAAAATASEGTNADKGDAMLSIEQNLAQLSLHDGEPKPQGQEHSGSLEKTHVENTKEGKSLGNAVSEGDLFGEVLATRELRAEQ